MKEAYRSSDGRATVLHGDCFEVMKSLPDASIDAIVCDPPAGIAFMGKSWDEDKGGRDGWVGWLTEVMREALRVLKPGGHAVVWALPRTSHWTAWALEDAGFEVRDAVLHCFGTGFPKSQDISKFIEKMDATDAAKQWIGWGSALKPSQEIWWLCRKPLDGTLAANTLKHGVGGLNIDACRIPFASAADEKESKDKNQHADFGTPPLTGNTTYGDYSMVQPKNYNPPGRWPANLLLAHSPACVHLDTEGDTDLWACVPGCPVRALDAQSGTSKSSGGRIGNATGAYTNQGSTGWSGKHEKGDPGFGDTGGASRYFMRFDPNDAPFIYCAKAATKERGEGVDGRNTHPTVKPVSVMRYLIKLVTPPSGVVLDPFMGSGTTGVAAMLENVRFIGIEREDEYIDIATQRIRHHAAPSRPTLTLTHPE